MIARPFTLRRLLALLLFLASCIVTAATHGESAPGIGYVEQARYLPDSHQLVISGWAAPESPNVFITNLIVNLGGREIYRGRIERSERRDVVDSTARSDWLWSGFSVRLNLPPAASTAPQLLSATMRLGSGQEFDLTIAPALRKVITGRDAERPSMFSRLALLGAVSAPLLALFGAQRLWGVAREKLFATSLLLSFALLVSWGWTGSSLGLLLDQGNVAEHDEVAWLGKLQPVRSDEWQVITPLALSQAAHRPAFPIVNRNLGLDGQNMMVVGMTGVPVAHVSALAKPATWGFFLFDLRRALAWYWWFPFFACFAALWMLLQRMFALDWRLAAGLAATVSASPYSVVFSGWPAYLVFFSAAGLLAADVAFRSHSWRVACGIGGLLGASIAGFALVLYPAWQISLAYVWLPLTAAWFATRRKHLRFGRPQFAAAGMALAVAVAILFMWWLDAREAIASIRGSVYPGQRSVEVGGDVDRWFLVKGLMSPMTMYRDSSLMVGASDAGSVVLFIVPLFAAVVLRFISIRRIDAIAGVLCGFILVALWFMYVGFPSSLARASLWGSTTSYRLDLSLGVAQVLIIAWLAAPRAGFDGKSLKLPGHTLAVALGVFTVLHAFFLYQLVPPAILENVPPSLMAMSLLVLGAGGYFLIREQYIAFFCVYGSWMLAAALPFNPLGLAPLAVRPAAHFAGLVPSSATAGGSRSAVAVVGDRNWAMSLPAAGVPVVNSVFYYPQVTLWHRLDPTGRLSTLYNRYQRVLFVLGVVESPQGFRIDSPRLDEVRVTIDSTRFDFRLLGAATVLATARESEALRSNVTLKAVLVAPTWVLFSVLP